MKRRIFYFFVIFTYFIVLPLPAEVVNNTRIKHNDPLLNLARSISFNGMINLSLIQDIPFLTAVYYSKLSPYKISRFFNNLFQQKGFPGKLAQCSACELKNVRLIWQRNVNGRHYKVNVLNDKKTGISAITVLVQIKTDLYRSEYDSLLESFPELLNVGGRISVKNEYIEGSKHSGLYIFNTDSRPEVALEAARRRLEKKGWQTFYGQTFSVEEGSHFCLLGKGEMGLSLIAQRKRTRTEMILTIHRD